jgi:hypothetical protein
MNRHAYCEGLGDGYRLKRELTKTSVKMLAVQEQFRESGTFEELKATAADWKMHFAKISNLVRYVSLQDDGEECKSGEAFCRKLTDRIFKLLIYLRAEMDLFSVEPI